MIRMAKQLVVACVLVGVFAGCAHVPSGPKAPLIGVTSVYLEPDESWPARIIVPMTYVESVREAGGVPVVLPALESPEVIREYLRRLDGLVLVGGRDIPPSAYGQDPHESVTQMPKERYAFESELLRQWFDTGKPVLGICLGSQFANVVRGGTLIQDIPTHVGKTVNHRGKSDAPHRVVIDKSSKLYEILGEHDIKVWANHHQSVDRLGEGLKIVARSDDGVVEATELPDYPFGIFVQWHPERMTEGQHKADLFGALIDASK